MRGVLNDIVENKRTEIAQRREQLGIQALMQNPQAKVASKSMKQAILDGSGLIAEFKRASPSKGVIKHDADCFAIPQAYELSGASAVSVLTDTKFFSGSDDDLICARSAINIPILRKDFIIDPYQVYESKAIGADCILLIAAILNKNELSNLYTIAIDCGLDVLVEIHDAKELDKLTGIEEIIGINNRNLDSFEVDIENSLRLAAMLPEAIKIAESGLGSGSNLKRLKDAGFHGFLVGESFMKEADPGLASRLFVEQIT